MKLLKTIKKIGFAALLIALASSCTELFQDKVNMTSDAANTSLADLFLKKEEIVQLDAPSEIFVSLYAYNDRVTVTWKNVLNAESYRLERAVVTQRNIQGTFDFPPDEDFEVIVHTSTLYECTYTDIIIDNTVDNVLDFSNPRYNYAYFYKVVAENRRMGYESSEPTYSSMAALLMPPLKLEATMGESEDVVELKWATALGATQYEIYRSPNEDGSGAVRIGRTQLTKFTDETAKEHRGQEFYYTVYAIASNKSQSVQSSIAMGYTLLIGAPPKITNVAVETGRGDVTSSEGIKITWTPSSVNGTKYSVFRTSSTNSAIKKLADDIDGSTYEDKKDLAPNTYYYYYVQAYTIQEVGEVQTQLKGPVSDSGPNSSKPAEGFIVSPPTNFSVSKIIGDPNNCEIRFFASIGDEKYINDSGKYSSRNANNYIIEGSASQSSGFTEVAKFTSAQMTYSSEDGYCRSNSTSRVPSRAYYRIKTEYDGKESLPSEVVAPAPYPAENVFVSRAELVGDPEDYKINNSTKMEESGANGNGVHPVRITWDAPSGGASGYSVWRSTKYDSGFKKITDNKITDTQYIDSDENLKAGIIYYYKVLSLNSLGQGVNYSVVDKPELFTKLDSNGSEYTDGNGRVAKLIKTKDANGNPYGRGFGWGALTEYQYMREHIKTVNLSHDKLSVLNTSNVFDMMKDDSCIGEICGKLNYTFNNMYAALKYTNYADFYINNNPELGIYLLFNGNTDTKADVSKNGNMYGIVDVEGMYPVKVRYDKVEVKGGDAGGGTFGVQRIGIDDDYQEITYASGL